MDPYFLTLDRYGVEGWGKFPSLYRAFVKSNKDPQARGRIQISCPDVGHTDTVYPEIWIDPLFTNAGDDRGSFAVPAVGDCVRVFFSRGDPDIPAGYLGGWYGKDEVPAELAPTKNQTPYKQGLITRGGHQVILDDTPNNPFVILKWHKPSSGDAFYSDETATADRSQGDSTTVSIDSQGTVSVETADNTQLQLKNKNSYIQDASGNQIILGDSSITITNSTGTTIEIIGSNINVKSQGTVKVDSQKVVLNAQDINLGSDFAPQHLAIAEKINLNFERIKNLFALWVPVPGDGGASLKALSTTLQAAYPIPMGSNTVKVTN